MGAAQREPSAAMPGIPLPRTLDDVLALAAEHRDIKLQTAIERDVRLVRFEPGQVEFEPVPGASPGLAHDLARRLQDWTGTRWMVAVATSGGAPSIHERRAAEAQARRDTLAADPVVARVLELFPGSRIVESKAPEPFDIGEDEDTGPPPPAPFEDEEIAYPSDEVGLGDSGADDL